MQRAEGGSFDNYLAGPKLPPLTPRGYTFSFRYAHWHTRALAFRSIQRASPSKKKKGVSVSVRS